MTQNNWKLTGSFLRAKAFTFNRHYSVLKYYSLLATRKRGFREVKKLATHLVSESESEVRSVLSDSLQPHGLYSLWNSPDQNTGLGSHSLLQEIFPTQGLNPGLLHCRQILYCLNYQGSIIFLLLISNVTTLRKENVV